MDKPKRRFTKRGKWVIGMLLSVGMVFAAWQISAMFSSTKNLEITSSFGQSMPLSITDWEATFFFENIDTDAKLLESDSLNVFNENGRTLGVLWTLDTNIVDIEDLPVECDMYMNTDGEMTSTSDLEVLLEIAGEGYVDTYDKDNMTEYDADLQRYESRISFCEASEINWTVSYFIQEFSCSFNASTQLAFNSDNLTEFYVALPNTNCSEIGYNDSCNGYDFEVYPTDVEASCFRGEAVPNPGGCEAGVVATFNNGCYNASWVAGTLFYATEALARQSGNQYDIGSRTRSVEAGTMGYFATEATSPANHDVEFSLDYGSVYITNLENMDTYTVNAGVPETIAGLEFESGFSIEWLDGALAGGDVQVTISAS